MSAGYAVVIERDGLRAPMLFGFGLTEAAALAYFRQQIAGGSPRQQQALMARATVVPLSEDQASEVAECLAAEAIGWVS